MRRLLLLGALVASLWALEVPPLTGRVVDTAGLFTAAQSAKLTAQLSSIETNTTHQIAVLTIPSLEDENLENYAHQVASTWQLGQAKKDNGVLLLIVKDSHDIRIEVGYGLEGALPDGLAGTIIRREMVPHFKEEHYYKGVKAAIEAIDAATRGEYTPEEPMSEEEEEFMWVVLGVIFFILSILSRINKPIASVAGAVAGAGVGLFFFNSFLLLIVLGLVGSVVGFVAGYLPVTMFMGGRGGRGGGGFSGGGGRFGGGGASGKW
ncbi:MAG: hypothetical protein KU37_11560 [Sulfuricurvum sp. PC08-66]|nr:MAG: hypothetical protein KU37_11560 [Sulfuricurvum sp. PC08-66]